MPARRPGPPAARIGCAILVLVLPALLVAAGASADYYETLGVMRTASEKEIRKAYHQLSLKYHPDKSEAPDAEAMFILVAKAYEVLSDPDKRRDYDNLSRGPGAGGAGGGSSGPGSFQVKRTEGPVELRARFGRGGFFNMVHHPVDERVAPDVEVRQMVRLEDVLEGRLIEVAFSREIVCPVCAGRGAEDEHEHMEPCGECRGSGRKIRVHKVPSFTQHLNMTCPVCEGVGRTVSVPCSHCGGARVVQDTTTVAVNVMPGTPEGHRVSYPGMGYTAPGYKPGAGILTIHTLPHKLFTRVGDDLACNVSISLIDSLIGFNTSITLLDGVEFVIERTDVSPMGSMVSYPGMGLPVHGADDTGLRGALHVHFQVKFPKKLTPDQKKKLEAILDPAALSQLEEMLRKRVDQLRLAVAETIDAFVYDADAAQHGPLNTRAAAIVSVAARSLFHEGIRLSSGATVVRDDLPDDLEPVAAAIAEIKDLLVPLPAADRDALRDAVLTGAGGRAGELARGAASVAMG